MLHTSSLMGILFSALVAVLWRIRPNEIGGRKKIKLGHKCVLPHTGLNEVPPCQYIRNKDSREEGSEGQPGYSTKMKREGDKVRREWRVVSMKAVRWLSKWRFIFSSNWLFMVKLLHAGEQRRVVIWHVKNEIQWELHPHLSYLRG